MKRTLLFFILFYFVFKPIMAQDIHWAHIYASPTYLNPAMNGLFQGDIRLIGNARTQWNNFTNGYKTVAASVDMKVAAMRNGDFFGGGVQFYSDKAGDLDYNTKSASGAISYLKALDRQGKNMFAFGIQNSIFNHSIDYSKVTGPGDVHAAIEGGTDQVLYWSISAGLAWFYSFDRYNSIYLGGSLFHMNNPMYAFVERNNPTEQGFLYRKIVLHGGADIRISRTVDLKPSFLYLDQGPNQEINGGLYVRYYNRHGRRRSADAYKVYVGGWLRFYQQKEAKGVDAVIASIRMDFKNTFLSFSYDFNISRLTRASSGQGGPEISIIRILKYPDKRRPTPKVKCPVNFN